jgi:tetratricopeptide (TPR) repeat protein
VSASEGYPREPEVSRPAWDEVELEAAREIADRRYQAAFDRLSQFLRDAESQDERREALALRATVRLRLGDAPSAQRDLELAHALSRVGEYARYTIELLLASVARERGDIESARRFYSQALRTVLNGNGFSAGSALDGIMSVAGGEGFSDAERSLVLEAVQASWLTLRLDAPMPGELQDRIRTIIKTERRT